MRHVVVALALSATLGFAPAKAVAQAPPATPTPLAAPQPPRPFPDGASIAFMSPPRVAAESALGKALAARMNAAREKKLAELNARNKQLESAQQKLAASSLLNEGARTAAQKDVDRILIDIQRAQQDAEAEMQDLQQQLNNEFERMLSPILKQVCLDKGVHVLFRADTGAIAWADPAVDLTDEIVKRLDAAMTAATVKPRTGPQRP